PQQCRPACFDQITGPAQERVVDGVGTKRGCQHRRDLRGIDPAVEELELLAFAREHVMHAKTIEKSILQLFEFPLEDDALCGAIAVEEHDLALQLPRHYA